MEDQEKVFVEGIKINQPSQSFVKASFGINLASFGAWVQKELEKDPTVEWFNIEFKESGRTGKPYAERVMPRAKEDRPPARQPEPSVIPWGVSPAK
jgi:hypothetical protein